MNTQPARNSQSLFGVYFQMQLFFLSLLYDIFFFFSQSMWCCCVQFFVPLAHCDFRQRLSVWNSAKELCFTETLSKQSYERTKATFTIWSNNTRWFITKSSVNCFPSLSIKTNLINRMSLFFFSLSLFFSCSLHTFILFYIQKIDATVCGIVTTRKKKTHQSQTKRIETKLDIINRK